MIKNLCKLNGWLLMVKDQNFRASKGDDTLCTPPHEQLLPLPTSYFKMFWEDSLMTIPLQASFTVPPPTPKTFQSYTWLKIMQHIGPHIISAAQQIFLTGCQVFSRKNMHQIKLEVGTMGVLRSIKSFRPEPT